MVVETYRQCLDDHLDLPRLRAFLGAIADGTMRVVTRRGEQPSPFVSELIFQFEHQFLYEWDDPKRSGRSDASPSVDEELLDTLLDTTVASLWLDASAIGRVEGRIRGTNHPPRTVDEMGETLRRLGDLADFEVAGPMLGFLRRLQEEGRAETIRLDGTLHPERWIGVEERELYESAFGDTKNDDALEVIGKRFLQTHALVSLDDVLARYPMDPATATELLERWESEGAVVRLDQSGDCDGSRWADPENLAEVRAGSPESPSQQRPD